MKKENKLRVIIWGILFVVTFSLGMIGLFSSGDVDFNSLSNWFENLGKNTGGSNKEPQTKIDFNKVAKDVEDFLNEMYIETPGYIASVLYKNNQITASIVSAESITFNFPIGDKIISYESEQNDMNNLMGLMIFSEITRSIQSEYDISEEEIGLLFSDDSLLEYTLSNNGIEYTENNGISLIKLDYTKKLNLPERDKYITIETLNKDEDNLEFLKGDGSFQFSNGYVTLYKKSSDTQIVITLFEKDITINSYNSLISILTVLFDETKANNFKTMYSSFSLGNKEFNGYSIEVDTTADSMEKVVMGTKNLKIVRITINKSLVK